ncbi:MAG: hypothetical protein KDC43_12545 [Saprospiraceae bacterium]|nr:hypothetical protein [Saprospiraceae bacterium]MCB0624708.1 hypothetical protein [Saprospiraceae bacterium]MCB0678724.1 hypothetical protein [Saprospiraceae bacterium]MCB0679990.1 hypothetical protein [Saprospiraceae bacterium]
MDFLGILFELLFLTLGVYAYLFAIGKITGKDPEQRAKAEAFRQANAWWLRILGLGLSAIMLVNLLLRLLQAMN